MPGFNLVGNKPIQPSNKIGPNRDIRRSHRWFIETLVGESTSNDSDFKLFAKKISLPQLSFEEEVFRSLGGEYKFAALPKFQDVTIEFYDVVGIAERLYELQSRIWSSDNGIKPAKNYKGTTQLIVQTSVGGGKDMRYTLHNSWIKNMTHSDLTYERADLKSVTLTLSYDYYTAIKVRGSFCEGIKQDTATTPNDPNYVDKNSRPENENASSDAPAAAQAPTAPVNPSETSSSTGSPKINLNDLLRSPFPLYGPDGVTPAIPGGIYGPDGFLGFP